MVASGLWSNLVHARVLREKTGIFQSGLINTGHIVQVDQAASVDGVGILEV